jgi:POT family proton-dependent oligopeptide transporter
MKSNQNNSSVAASTNSKEEAKMPGGIRYIIGNELAEMFSSYGMRAILIIFMTQYIFDSFGSHIFTNSQAMVWYHNYNAAARFFSIIAAIIADAILGKYKTILVASIIYCFGHLTLALFDSKIGLACGLILIAIGSGGVMPCVFAHLGDQFNRKNQKLISKAYGWFYFTINFGSFFGVLLTPYLIVKYGPEIAFFVPALLMFIAIIIFYRGRKFFTTIPPIGWKKYVQEFKDISNLRLVGNLAIIFAFTVVFHALYSQAGSSWVIQAGKMNRDINLGFAQINIHPAQIQAINQVLILIFIPLFPYAIYPFFEKFTKVTHLKKIAAGFFVIAASFAVIAYAQTLLERGMEVGVIWQIWAFVLLSISEVLVMVTSIEVCYIHSPTSMKSLIVGFYALSESFGNGLVAGVNGYFQDKNGNLTIAISDYFWYFSCAMLVAAILFVIYIPHYRSRIYLQLHAIKEIFDIIIFGGKGNIAFITLSGSFARRNLSQNGNIVIDMKYEYDDNYNFLIITKDKDQLGLKQAEAIKNRIISELVNCGLRNLVLSKQKNITFLVKSIYSIKLDVAEDRPISDLIPESILLYGSSRAKLSDLYSKEKKKTAMTTHIYQYWYNKGSDFLKAAKILDGQLSDNTLVAFSLHQAVEHFYGCSLFVLTGDKPKSHILKELNYLLTVQSNKFNNIFPLHTEYQIECFELLEESYSASRYERFFSITDNQLKYLSERIEELEEITKEVCEKEIEALESSKIKTKPNQNNKVAPSIIYSI